jgi:inner membrane protein
VDPLTHGLASYALKRGFFSRAPRATTLAMILAGVIADVDWLSYYFGPSAFLSWHGTYTHSLVVAVASSLVIAALVALVARKSLKKKGRLTLFAGAVGAGLLHVAMDACQSTGIALWWPFRQNRVALDWLPNFDPWILALLLAAILIPELFLLVSGEIGAKTNRPRGRFGALAGLVLFLLYGGARATLHSSALAMLQTRIYGGESPRRVAAFPDPISPFTWHGIVETESALHLLEFSVAPGAFFNPEGAVAFHKPDPSAVLDAAQKAPAARQFLNAARFPKATVLKEITGYSVEVRDLRYAAMAQTAGAIQAEINLDLAGNVTFAQLEWQKDKRHR